LPALLPLTANASASGDLPPQAGGSLGVGPLFAEDVRMIPFRLHLQPRRGSILQESVAAGCELCSCVLLSLEERSMTMFPATPQNAWIFERPSAWGAPRLTKENDLGQPLRAARIRQHVPAGSVMLLMMMSMIAAPCSGRSSDPVGSPDLFKPQQTGGPFLRWRRQPHPRPEAAPAVRSLLGRQLMIVPFAPPKAQAPPPTGPSSTSQWPLRK